MIPLVTVSWNHHLNSLAKEHIVNSSLDYETLCGRLIPSRIDAKAEVGVKDIDKRDICVWCARKLKRSGEGVSR